MAAIIRREAGDPTVDLVDAMRTHGPLTRADLGALTGLSRTTVSNALMDLRRRKLVDDADHTDTVQTGGRPASRVALTSRAGLAVGIDLGRTHVAVSIADGGHRVLTKDITRFDIGSDADGTIELAKGLVEKQLLHLGTSTDRVLGIGIGIPAPLDQDGRVGSSNILPGWIGRTPADELEKALNVPVRAENDANLGALAEFRWGAGRGHQVVVYIKAASGIGAGLVVGGRLFRGASGTAGELGHVVVMENGPVCRCGNRGCLEMLAGGPALIAHLSPSKVDVHSVAELVDLARSGDPSCRRVLADAGEYIGIAVANLVNLMNPELIVFGGELSLAGDLVLDTLRARVTRASLPPAAAAVSIVPGVLGDRAESLGGALLVLGSIERFDPDRAAAYLTD
jgi:predicted NBD/HSP70 family sugar kinase